VPLFEPSADAQAGVEPADLAELVEVGAYASTAEGFERGLVALAIGAPFWLMPGGDAFRLLVREDDVARVREQLAWFEEESAHWPPRPMLAERLAMRRADWFTPLLWVLAVIASFWMQGESREWTAWGALDARAVFERGEAWRPFTALFLHADVGHLVSNALSGIFLFSAVVTTMGRWRGWLLLALASVLGNFAAAAADHGGDYRSIGASTAVFAALGLLTGRAVREAMRDKHPQRWRGVFVPLAAGFAVLGLYGAGGVDVDVVAHVTGFGAGFGLGFGAGKVNQRGR
jgi:membrane associated rhomboid family serine protease